MGTNWTIEVIGSNLEDKYLWLRSNGFPDYILNLLRETYKEMLSFLDKGHTWNPEEDLFVLMLIRKEERIEGFSSNKESKHVIVDLEMKQIRSWIDKKLNSIGIYPLEDNFQLNENPSKRRELEQW